MLIDLEALRNDLLEEDYGAYYVGGFGGALSDSFRIQDASPEHLVRIARERRFDLRDYEVYK